MEIRLMYATLNLETFISKLERLGKSRETKFQEMH